MLKKLVLLMALVLVTSMSLSAADLEETLESLSGIAARSYVSPMTTSFGSDMNGGWFHQTPKNKLFGWDFEVGVVMMGTMFTNDDKKFNVTGSFNLTREQAELIASDEYESMPYYDEMINQMITQSFQVNISGPTITGAAYDETTGENSIIVDFPEQPVSFTYNNATMTQTLPGTIVPLGIGGLLEDLPFMPLAAPQLSIGTVYGTKLFFRYLPAVELTPEIGKLNYFGYGIQHNPLVWLPTPSPVDVAVAFYTQKMDIGTIIETSALTYGINASKTFGTKLVSVTPYLGLSGENSKMKFHYDYPTGSTDPIIVPETIKIKFDVEGKNTSRITAGLSFRLALVNLNVDYNLAKYPSVTTGMMLNFSW